jgi:hypothetical protein
MAKAMAKRILKAGLLVLAGLAVGYTLACASTKRVIGSFCTAGLLEMAIDVNQLQQGRADAVLARKRRALPDLVQQYDVVFLRSLPDRQRNEVLWAVSRCYGGSAPEAPPSIKPLLDALPPRPPTSCELKAKAEATKTEEATEARAEQPAGAADPAGCGAAQP